MLARTFALLCAASSVACIKSPEVVCDGFICPPGSECDNDNQRCIDPAQANACAGDGVMDGDLCSFGAIEDGVCEGGLCVARACGNGIVENLEQCEVGNLVTPFSCLSLGFDFGHASCLDTCDLDPTPCESIGFFDTPANGAGAVQDVFGASASDVYAVGTKLTLVHFDGVRWAAVDTGGALDGIGPDFELNGVWVDPSGAVVAVGAGLFAAQSVVVQFDGSTWQALESPAGAPNLQAVWGFSPDDVYAAGVTGTIIHFDGSGWSPVRSGGSNLNAIWGSDPSNIYAVGSNGTVLHSTDGVSWDPQVTATSAALFAIWGSSAASVFAGGGGGTLLHTEDGSTWIEDPDNPFNGLGVVDIFGHSDRDVIVTLSEQLSGARLSRFDGARWWELDALATTNIIGVWRAPSGEAFVAAGDRVLQSSGTVEAVVVDSLVELSAVWKRGDVIVAVGAAGTIALPSGQTLTGDAVPPVDLHDVYGDSRALAYAVGDAGAIVELSREMGGTYRAAVTSKGSAALRAVWMGDGAVFAVGDGGTILLRNGTTWSAMESGTAVALFGVYGTSGEDVYAVGEIGTVLHYDGTAWSAVDSGTDLDLRAVWAGGGEVFAVGPSGLVLRRADEFVETVSNTDADLLDIDGVSPTDVFALGGGETILHWDGATWAPVRGNRFAEYVGVSVEDNSVVVGGKSGTVQQITRTVPWQ